MTTIEHSIFINASAEEIDAVTLDATRLPEWYPGVESAQPDDVYPEVGGQAQIVYKVVGIKFDVTFTVRELNRGHGATFEIDGMIKGTNTWTYTPEGDGVRVTAVYDYEMPGGGLGQVANKLVVQKMNDENLKKSLENLKALVEG
ncbi:MAG: hypothetical protein D6737_12610 [Chloroflexi bacterium]|nr:MAG: hypothetical protein D6737_12610 [Chloroflexota bacterium]